MSDQRRIFAENGPPPPDGRSKTVVIPVRVMNGIVTSISGGDLPTMSDCVGELRVSASCIKNDTDLAALSAEQSIPLLPKGTILLCRLATRHVPAELRADCVEELLPKPDDRFALFVQIILQQDLMLRFRGTKIAPLCDAACSVPKMADLKVASVNEAYANISRKFEPSRRSAGGSVFLNVYYKPSPESRVVPLGELRDERVGIWDSYLRTVFTAATPDGQVEIRAGHESDSLNRLLRAKGTKDWAYVTAYNPGSRLLNEDVNRGRHRELLAKVESGGWDWFEGQGVGLDAGWPPETSLLIIGIPLEEARRFGSQFGQLAIVAGRLGEPSRLVPCAIEKGRTDT